jgi:hypothetical protein
VNSIINSVIFIVTRHKVRKRKEYDTITSKFGTYILEVETGDGYRENEGGFFSNYTFVFEYETEKDESVSAGLKDFDLFVNAKNKEQAVHDLAVELVEYSKEYLNNIQLYFNATNRRDHFPFVMNVLLQEDLAEVIKLIHTEQP